MDNIIMNKAATIARCIARVKEECGDSIETLDKDRSRYDAAVLNIQRMCEASIDIANHIIRIKSLGIPQNSRESFVLLEQHHLITPEMSRSLQAMIGFRNIAVHDYQTLDATIVKAVITHKIKDIQQFSQDMIGVVS